MFVTTSVFAASNCSSSPASENFSSTEQENTNNSIFDELPATSDCDNSPVDEDLLSSELNEMYDIFDEEVPETSRKEIKSSHHESDGEINYDFCQGNLGDCALLSTLYSLSNTDEGAEAISNAIKHDEAKNQYSVTFDGIGETYTVSQTELDDAINGANGRQYSYGDDDVTILELAFEKCFEKSENEVIRDLVDKYTKENADDKLNGVNPASVTYALMGIGANDISDGTGEKVTTKLNQFTPSETYELKDVDGNSFTFDKDEAYMFAGFKRNKNTNEITKVGVFDPKTNEETWFKYGEFNEKFLPQDTDGDIKEYSASLFNKFKTDDTSALIYAMTSDDRAVGDSGTKTVKLTDASGKEVPMYLPHAYSVAKVEEVNGENVVTLVNPHNTSESYNFKMDTLLNIQGFRLYGADWE